MSTTTTHGGRLARLLDDTGEGWYHVYNRVACEKDQMPLSEKVGSREAFIKYLDFYTQAYRCQLATYVVMGNHYHLILKMDDYRELSQAELKESVKLFYPNTYDQVNRWNDSHWEHFNKRLFSLSDLMRNIQQGFARWYNKNHKRRGRFWADRFKSTILLGEDSLIECMQYVDLNSIRAGLVKRPEDYIYSGFALRTGGEKHNLCDLKGLVCEKSQRKALESYRALVYTRGGVRTKENTAEICAKAMDREMAQNFDLSYSNEKRDHFRFYVDGLVVGSKEKILSWIHRLRSEGTYLRRKNPIPIKKGLEWFSIREQRSHFDGYT
jgi:REP element-mobilizing transposase RayT